MCVCVCVVCTRGVNGCGFCVCVCVCVNVLMCGDQMYAYAVVWVCRCVGVYTCVGRCTGIWIQVCVLVCDLCVLCVCASVYICVVCIYVSNKILPPPFLIRLLCLVHVKSPVR